MIGDTAITGALHARNAARTPGTARIGSMLMNGFDGQITTARNCESAAEIVRYRRQALARLAATGALDMGREIAVAEAEPGLAAERFEGGHEGPRLAAPAPAEL